MVLITVRLRMDTVDNAITKPVHRLEVFTGAGRRRTWIWWQAIRNIEKLGFRESHKWSAEQGSKCERVALVCQGAGH
jgi:hypothetical protein